MRCIVGSVRAFYCEFVLIFWLFFMLLIFR